MFHVASLALSAIAVLALSRAEILERMKAPVITRVNGLVQVYADCPADMRREYQSGVAAFAADTVRRLYSARRLKEERFAKAGIIVHVGDGRTNRTDVVSRVEGARTRIYLPCPGFSDIDAFRREIVKAFHLAVLGEKLGDAEADESYRRSDPRFHITEERDKIERWLAGGPGDDEEHLKLMRRIIEPGTASRRDVLTFASRLYLYPLYYDAPFLGRIGTLPFRDAVAVAKKDPRVRLAAYLKSRDMIILGGGRGDAMTSASQGYARFLAELAKGDLGDRELLDILDGADEKLNLALEEARLNEEGRHQ